MREIVALALVAGAAASPVEKDKWHFQKKPHGWYVGSFNTTLATMSILLSIATAFTDQPACRPKPSIYTPPQAPPTSTQSSTYGFPTGGSYNGTATISAPPYPTATTSVGTGACASVSKLAAADPAATPTVPAKLAYDCITSVPFNSSAAVELLDSIRPYLDWQSTVDYIRDPPAEYAEKIQEPYDFWAAFEKIYDTAESNGYDNEFAFGFDLYEVVSAIRLPWQ